ncbi:hypothetical protein V039C_0057 [Vibrio phage V039C]|nr:hypothetical protein V039C_0057 [Vibrio phage V039C]
MARRKSNKQVKQMICSYYDDIYNAYLPYFGAYFSNKGINFAYPGGWGPDNYCDESDRIERGVISLTASQLRGES